MTKFYYVVIVCLTFCINISMAQTKVLHPTEVKTPLLMDKSAALRDIPGIPSKPRVDRKDNVIPNHKYYPPRNTAVDTTVKTDQAQQVKFGEKLGGDIIQNFNGVANRNYVYPPDPNGDVSATHYFETVNCSFQIWNKTGTSLYGPYDLSTLWQNFPGPWAGLSDGDPIVIYDDIANRWFVSQFALPNYPNGPFYQLVAVSATSDPLGSWYRYAYSFTNMNDYPKFGVWPDGYYMSTNMFTTGSLNYAGSAVAVWDRASMLAGSSTARVQVVYFTNANTSPWSFLPSDCDGTPPPAGTPNYFIWSKDNASYGGNDQLQIYEFHVNWADSTQTTFTGPLSLDVNSFTTMPTGVAQPSTTVKLDDLSDRLMNRLQYRNFGTYQAMVTSQTVNAGSGRAGVRWYQLKKTTGSWSISQQATYAPADGLNRWMSSIAMDSVGNIALGYSVSSSTVYPSIRFTGRLVNDTLNTMSFTEKTIIAGTGSQTGTDARWGDYNSMSIDPDGLTFWYCNQYVQTTGATAWKTRIASFQLNSVVPVELTTFSASLNNNTAALNWKTATETNNRGFEVERADASNDNWQKIGFVPGTGTSTVVREYSFVDNSIKTGSKYSYRLKQMDFDGEFHYSNVIEVEGKYLPRTYSLEQNYPNPFNPSTVIKYAVPFESNVKLTIYNTLGEAVKVLSNAVQTQGAHEVTFNASGLSSGIYFYTINANSVDGKSSFTSTRKMMLVK
ncbi:MAG: T9SS type A sorting domain-containing protein [Bacteroidota bacterium]|nr:T9SS type A sorting domain-containing protein [Bacteroidota bacterium]